ncbi:MAG: SDR family NAD(P)-dependent oxidoreductase [Solirubrobacteraceae bacterium]
MDGTTKVAIITGASRGIGAGLVTGFRSAGFTVVGVSRSIKTTDEPGYLAAQGDITNAESARRVVDLALARFGRIDTLVNNAGLFASKPFTDYTGVPRFVDRWGARNPCGIRVSWRLCACVSCVYASLSGRGVIWPNRRGSGTPSAFSS